MRELSINNTAKCPKNIIISGPGRSGKTTLCKLWASAKGIEWLEEPVSMILLSYAFLIGESSQSAGINKNTYEMLWELDLKERAIDMILGRSGMNFRPSDLSSVWGYKDAEEILNRIVNLRNRQDVYKYIEQYHTVFLIDIPEFVYSLSSLSKEKNNCKMVAMIRNPYGVAQDVSDKGWFSDKNMIDPVSGNNFSYIYHYGSKDYFLPFWVREEDADEFLESSDYVRGIIYWISISEDIIRCKNSIDDVIRYEDIISDPMEKIVFLCDRFGGKITSTTQMICDSIKNRESKPNIHSGSDRLLSSNMLKRLKKCCDCWEYSV